MYQIFYIDIDEEITSIIDRLRKSRTTENFFVVSPRSLLLQSVVSLKLLKKESDKLKKQIAIIVNEKESKIKIEKAGILALASLKGLESGDEIKENFGDKMKIRENNKNKYKNNMEKTNKKSRLQKIGTENFFNGQEPVQKLPEKPVTPQPFKEEPIPPKMADVGYPSKSQELPETMIKPKNVMDVQDFQRETTSFSYAPEKNIEEVPIDPPVEPSNFNPSGPSGFNKMNGLKEMDPHKEKIVEVFFNPTSRVTNDSKEKVPESKIELEKSIPVSHKMRKIVFSFVAICILAILGISAYLFVPKVKISVATREETKKVDFEIKGDLNIKEIDKNELVIPAKLVEKEGSETGSFKSTGKKSSSSGVNNKAKGKITIYNEYGSEEQQLVATTRFLSSEGKLFRLVKGVVVPGMSDSEPGKVEVEVMADQAGEDFNIGPSNFKIPGFEGNSQKYQKFYAKSTANMTGGGASSDSSGITIISQADVDGAKKDSELKLKEKLISDVKSETGNGSIVLEDAVEISVSESITSSKVNEVSNAFDYSTKGKIKVIVFSENDLKKIVGEIYNEADKEKNISDYSAIKVSYGASSVDFNSGTINIKLQAEISVSSEINWDEFKTKLLGKNEEQIKEILKDYPQIDKINIDFWPKFMSQKIPQYEKRVSVEIN